MQAPLTLSGVRALTKNEIDSLIVAPLSATADFFDELAKVYTPLRSVLETEKRRRQLFARLPMERKPAPQARHGTRRRNEGAKCK